MTAHTCCPPGRGPAWGKKTPGCPRCDELLAGAEPRSSWRSSRREDDERRAAEIREHFASAKHRSGGCGPVCTFGDW
jgi:hypothetical protein